MWFYTGSYFRRLYISGFLDAGLARGMRAASRLEHARDAAVSRTGGTVLATSRGTCLSLPFPSWRSARHRSWWAPRSLDSMMTEHRMMLHCIKTALLLEPAAWWGWLLPTFCCRACSWDSFFICSFLKLAVSAMFSELDFVRTWAISSLALSKTSKYGNENTSSITASRS